MTSPRTRLAIGLVLAALSVCGFASTFIFGAALTKTHGVSPLVLSFMRFAVAGAVMFAFEASCGHARRKRLFAPSRQTWRRILWLGPVGTSLMAWCVFMGCARVSAANASMADALTPLMIFLVAAVRARRLERRALFGLASGFLGALFVIQVISRQGIRLEAYSLGDVYILLSAATWGVYTVFGRALIARLGSSVFTTWTMLVGALSLVPFLVLGSPVWPRTAAAWQLVAGLALVSTLLPFWAWNAAQKYLPTSLLAVCAYFTPAVAVALATFFLGEISTPLQWLGTLFIIVSAVVETGHARSDAAQPARRRVLILGRGVSGVAAADLARHFGYVPQILDGDMPFPDDVADVAFAVVSPGIPLDHPWQEACRARNIPRRSEVQYGCETLAAYGWQLLAVTGSKGKSSVVKVVAEALCRAGRHGVACGNYGLPVSAVALETCRTEKSAATGVAVVEVSSFMLETTDLPLDFFVAASVLNLQEDHLDRHGGVAAYHALKRRLLGFTAHPLDGSDDARARGTCAEDALFAHSYFDNDVLCVNARQAVGLLRAAHVDDACIAAAFAGFRPLPHRMNEVAVIDGVRYIDDSKATSVAALAAALSMLGGGRRVHLIAGGLGKGDNPKIALPLLTSRVKKVYLIGRCAEVFRLAWSDFVDCEVCGDLDRAVRSARGNAVSGEAVLLSPGAASFDQFNSFEARGDVFAQIVKKKE